MRKFVEPKGATAQVENALVGRCLRLEVGSNRVQALLAMFLDFEQARFTHDAQVLRHVILRHLKLVRDFSDT